VQRLRGLTKRAAFGPADAEAIRENLKAFCNRNLYEVTFREKLDIISKLGIKVYPSKDLTSMGVLCMGVLCELNLEQLQADKQNCREDVDTRSKI